MSKTAWIVYGGWEGHQPKEISEQFKAFLAELGFDCEMHPGLTVLEDEDRMMNLDLLVPMWTMGELSGVATRSVLKAVEKGMGLAGCHGGMGDAFRTNTDWQFLTGGQFVSHPGNDGTEYRVNIKRGSSSVLEGIPDFSIKSEQYYVHIDPAIEVLATTRFMANPSLGPHTSNGEVDVPVVWTKRWGRGRVFYNSLGHNTKVFDQYEPAEIMKRGFRWATRK